MNSHAFKGFSEETLHFFARLKVQNEKSFFEENRHIYDHHVLPEAQAFVVDMGERLRTLSPGIQAIPKIDKSIFRLHRDIRFSPNKEPYKTHLGIFFWEGPLKKMESSGFYFQLTAEHVFFGVGIHMFSPQILEAYRRNVADVKRGEALKRIISEIKTDSRYDLGWSRYKRVPRGIDADHPHADLLKYGGLGFSLEEKLPDSIDSAGFIDYCFDVFEPLLPIHIWLKDLLYSNF
jgi:uncharacterized protein (TIGR02453 family)